MNKNTYEIIRWISKDTMSTQFVDDIANINSPFFNINVKSQGRIIATIHSLNPYGGDVVSISAADRNLRVSAYQNYTKDPDGMPHYVVAWPFPAGFKIEV